LSKIKQSIGLPQGVGRFEEAFVAISRPSLLCSMFHINLKNFQSLIANLS